MDKEREHEFESGFSEKQADLAVDRDSTNNLNQVKAGNIFDPKKKIVKEKIILDSTSQ